MKILLLGEYSGLYTELSRGLKQLGHDVFMASTGDGFRDYFADFRWDTGIKGRPGVVADYLNLFLHKKRLTGFDIVQVVTPFILPQIGGKKNNYKLFKFLKENNSKVFLSGAGLSYVGFNYWYNHPESKYYNYVMGPVKASEESGNVFKLIGPKSTERMEEEMDIMSIIDGYIAIMYEYVEYYKDHPAYKGCIPIPIDTSKYNFYPNEVNQRVVFFHGKSRPSKGGKYILAAFDQMKLKYDRYAEFISEGGLPFADYLRLLQRTNVVLDDANAYSLGLNSLYSMVQGRIVMGGAEPVADACLGYDYNPAINLYPDVDYISQKIEWVLDNQSNVSELGKASRELVEKYHDCIKVANEYLKTWGK